MKKIKYPEPVDYKKFKSSCKELDTYYGLPNEVKYCKSCVISNQRPNSAVEFNNKINQKKSTIAFDENGICDACNFANKKNSIIDWSDREKQLLELCDQHRKNDGSYDCIVPGSGGKDSFYASHILKNKYNMHPLTVTWAPHIYTDWGWRNFQAWIHAGHDNYLMTPNGKIHRLLTRLSTELLLHPFQPFILGQKSIATKVASSFNIPLVFYGENEAEYGNPITNNEHAKRSSSFASTDSLENLLLGGVKVNDLIKDFNIELNDLHPYLPLSKEIVSKKKIEVHYLGYYLKWHPQSCYYYAVQNSDFSAAPERTPGTYSTYNSIDDKIDDLHYLTTRIKFGIGRASYDAAQEIRSGDITRDEGVALVKKFDHEFPSRFIDELYSYISLTDKDFPNIGDIFEKPHMDDEYFKLLIDTFRSPHLWTYGNDGWSLRNPLV
jgi:N-acetyl sugar amidotransferase